MASVSGYYDILNLPSGAPAKYGALFPVAVSYGSLAFCTIGRIDTSTQRMQVFVTPEMISQVGSNSARIIVDTFYWIA